MSRTGDPIDELVRGVIAERLRQPDALRSVAATNSPRLTGLQAEIDEQRGRIARAEHDYDAGLLEAADLKRNRTRANLPASPVMWTPPTSVSCLPQPSPQLGAELSSALVS